MGQFGIAITQHQGGEIPEIARVDAYLRAYRHSGVTPGEIKEIYLKGVASSPDPMWRWTMFGIKWDANKD